MGLDGVLWRAIPSFLVLTLLLAGVLQHRLTSWAAVPGAVLYLAGAELLRRKGRLHPGHIRHAIELAMIGVFHAQISAVPHADLLYHVANARAATLLPRTSSLLFAAAASAVYHGIAWLFGGPGGAPADIFFGTVAFLLVALLANHLAAMERRERGKKAAIEDLVAQLQTAYEQMAEYARQAREMAITDEMTGLYNYRYFSEQLRREAARAGRTGEVFSLLLIDVDHFKRFNDTYGHPAGDRLLREIAAIIKASVREMDIVARYGGEEFAVILPETGQQEVLEVGERIRRRVAKHPCLAAGGDRIAVTVSVGAATYPLDADSHNGLVEAADRYLYKAKTVRNRVVGSCTGAPQQATLL